MEKTPNCKHSIVLKLFVAASFLIETLCYFVFFLSRRLPLCNNTTIGTYREHLMDRHITKDAKKPKIFTIGLGECSSLHVKR